MRSLRRANALLANIYYFGLTSLSRMKKATLTQPLSSKERRYEYDPY